LAKRKDSVWPCIISVQTWRNRTIFPCLFRVLKYHQISRQDTRSPIAKTLLFLLRPGFRRREKRPIQNRPMRDQLLEHQPRRRPATRPTEILSMRWGREVMWEKGRAHGGGIIHIHPAQKSHRSVIRPPKGGTEKEEELLIRLALPPNKYRKAASILTYIEADRAVQCAAIVVGGVKAWQVLLIYSTRMKKEDICLPTWAPVKPLAMLAFDLNQEVIYAIIQLPDCLGGARPVNADGDIGSPLRLHVPTATVFGHQWEQLCHRRPAKLISYMWNNDLHLALSVVLLLIFW
jgi:hypothetical protein